MPARRSTVRPSFSLVAALALAGALPLLWPAASARAAGGTERRTLAGDEVAIHNLAGRLTVEPGSGPSVVVEIATNGKDAGRLRIEDGPIDGRPTLRVIYPGDRIHVPGMSPFSSTTLRVRDDGTIGGERREGRRVTLSGAGGGLEASADLVVRVPKGKKVSITWGRGNGDVRGVDGDLALDAASMDVEARDARGSFRVEVGSGAVRLTGMAGEASIETGSGDVTVRDARGEGLKVETGSGRIEVAGVDADRLRLSTGSGDLRAASVRAPHAALESGSGSVEVRLDADVDDLSLETGSGDVTVSVPDAFGAAVHFETGSGDIDSDVPITIGSRSRHEIDGVIGDGNGRFQVETGSGHITIQRDRG
ncbi:MAG: DUF4097 family beta strand repeat-containing protein [Hyphomicrobiales bacterium]